MMEQEKAVQLQVLAQMVSSMMDQTPNVLGTPSNVRLDSLMTELELIVLILSNNVLRMSISAMELTQNVSQVQSIAQIIGSMMEQELNVLVALNHV